MGRPAKALTVTKPEDPLIALGPDRPLEAMIRLIRGQKIMLDADLAALYEVPTKRLNEAVKRNLKRFPATFMFQLTSEEAESLRSQFATSNKARGGSRYLPYAFTEHGVVTRSSVLNSDRAIQMSILVVNAFVQSPRTNCRQQRLSGRDRKTRAVPPPDRLRNRGPGRRHRPARS